jgi:hypothetical protein
MTDILHRDLLADDLHIPGFMQSDDPGAVGAGKLWIDTSGVPDPAVEMRDPTNTRWLLLGTERQPQRAA